MLTASPALSQTPTPTPKSYSLLDTIGESMFGDVYAEPVEMATALGGQLLHRGLESTLGESARRNRRGAPRQGWLNTFDGVFYRLGVVTGTFAHDFHDNGDQYTAGLNPLHAAQLAVRGAARRSLPLLEPRRVGQ